WPAGGRTRAGKGPAQGPDHPVSRESDSANVSCRRRGPLQRAVPDAGRDAHPRGCHRAVDGPRARTRVLCFGATECHHARTAHEASSKRPREKTTIARYVSGWLTPALLTTCTHRE